MGTWFEQFRDSATWFEYGECTTADYKLNDDGSIKIKNAEFNPKTGVSRSIVGRGQFVDAELGDGDLEVKFTKYMPAGSYKVVDTDYTNFAVVYSCASIPFDLLSLEFVWILTRE